MTVAEPEVATTHGLDAAEPAHIRKVRRALEQMPTADRELLYLFNVDRFPTAEIAAMLGTSPGAVRVRLSRARDRFRSSYRGTP
jgi:RNA polymerase sigma-70 factor (ECF subfamily)